MTQTKPEGKPTPARINIWLHGISPRSLRIALGLLAVGLILTALASLYIKAEVEAAAQREFDFTCNEIQINIADRLNNSAQILRSGAALFDASDDVTREEWRTFAGKLQIDRQLPGTQGIGFSLLIPRGQLTQHITEIRSEGFPEYQVKPVGERELYSSIIYLEPFSGRNLRAFGYDMFSEPVRRAAMEKSRDENIAALSGKVILVQETEEDVQAGTLMYVPVYRHGLPIETVEQRRAAIIGWVYSPYRMTDLMRGTLRNWEAKQKDRQITMQIYDGDVLSADTLLYDSQSVEEQALASTVLITKLTSVDFAGRRWTLRFTQLGGLASTADYDSVRFVSIGGTIISLLLFGLMLSLLSTRASAQKIAEHLTAELRESEEKYRTVANFTYDWEAWHAPSGVYLYVSPSCERITGYTAAEFLADANLIVKIAHPDDQPKVVEHFYSAANHAKIEDMQFDFRIITRGGETRWISHHCTAVYAENGEWLGRRESNRDITNRKRAEEALTEESARRQLLFEQSPDGILVIDPPTARFVEFNTAVHQQLGYSREEFAQLRIFDVEAQETIDDTRAQIANVIQNGKADFDTLQRTKQGEIRNVHVTAQIINIGERPVYYCVWRDITERKLAEEALRESENNFSTFFNGVEDLLFVLDAQGNIIKANATACRRLKYTEAELIGQHVLQVHPPERRAEAAQIVGDMLAGKRSECPVPVMAKDGGLIDVETYITRGTWNGQDALFGVTKDISEIKRSEEKFAKAFHMNSILMAISTLREGIYVDVNEAFCTSLGYAKEEVIGKTAVDLFLLDDISQRNFMADEMRKNDNHLHNFEFKIRARDGSIREGLFSAEQIELDGQPHLLTMFLDITERKQADTQREAALEKSRENEARYRSLFEQVHDAVFILDLKGNHIAANQRAADMLGYRLDEMLKLSVRETSAEVEQSGSVISRLIAGEQIPLYERLFRRKDGQIISTEVSVELVQDEHGNPLHIQSVIRDITERKQTEEEIKQLNAHLEQRVEERTQELRDAHEKIVRQEKLAALGQMTGSVGHELRNPLGVLSNSVYFLKMIQPDAPDKVKEYLDLIERNIHIADKIVGDLLDFTRVKSLERARISIPDLIHQTLERFPAPKSVQVEIDLPADLPRAYADPQHVIQVLGNLMLNAYQAMKDGGKLHILSRVVELVLSPVEGSPVTDRQSLITDHQLLIAVRDTGSGISPENMKKLFEPLFTTKPKGIGLGLAVCKKLIEANGGRIEAESDGVPGKGSTFTIWLPVHK